MATKKKPTAAPKRKPTVAKPGKTKQDSPDGVTPPPMMTRVKITVRRPAGPTIPPKRKSNATPAPTKPKTRAKSTGRSQQNRYDQEQWTPRPKPYFEQTATGKRVVIPARGYNYTESSTASGKPASLRRREIDQAQMNAQQAGQRRRINEVRAPEEEQWEPVPNVPNKQWASVPKRKTWTKKGNV